MSLWDGWNYFRLGRANKLAKQQLRQANQVAQREADAIGIQEWYAKEQLEISYKISSQLEQLIQLTRERL